MLWPGMGRKRYFFFLKLWWQWENEGKAVPSLMSPLIFIAKIGNCSNLFWFFYRWFQLWFDLLGIKQTIATRHLPNGNKLQKHQEKVRNMFQVNNKDTRLTSFLLLTLKNISHLSLVFLLLTMNKCLFAGTFSTATSIWCVSSVHRRQ